MDSGGQPPLPEVDRIYDIMNKQIKLEKNYSRIRMQSGNFACGYYSLWYLCRRIANNTHEETTQYVVRDDAVHLMKQIFMRDGDYNLHPTHLLPQGRIIQ